MASRLPDLPIFTAIKKHNPKQTAIIHSVSGRTFTYGSLLHDVAAAKECISEAVNGKSIQGERVAFLAENGYDYVVSLLSILALDAIALPLAPSFPRTELQYITGNSSPIIFLSTEKFKRQAEDVLQGSFEHRPQLCVLEKIETGATSAENVTLQKLPEPSCGLMLYTSGTTSRPKGVVLPSPVITAQAQSLIEAWRYSPSDLLLHVLPLHHIHGAINALFAPLLAGCTIEFAFPFNADVTWRRLAAPFMAVPQGSKRPVTVLTAVPTIYSRLLSSHSTLDADTRNATRRAISSPNLRLNISGSAALPTPIKSAWTKLSDGNVLLERYGMTEVGMALSCGLASADRVDGSVGWPLPSVQVRLFEAETGKIVDSQTIQASNETLHEGEIQLRGPTIFSEYWQNLKATADEFVEGEDGQGKWFKTGDIAYRRVVEGTGQSDQDWAKGPMYFIKGRSSVDIIKTGGEKVSALEVERELLSLPQIAEVAVIGLESDQWGQKVAAVVVLNAGAETAGRGGKPWGLMDLRRALKDKLVNYKIPQELKVVEGLPRNAMGKVNKKSLKTKIFGDVLN